MIDLINTWIVKLACIFWGLVVFFRFVFAAIFGGLGGSAAVGVAVVDMLENFNNPNYTSLEEMGFQQ